MLLDLPQKPCYNNSNKIFRSTQPFAKIRSLIVEENRTHTPCGENFSRLLPNLVLQDAYLASTRFDKTHQKIQRRRVLRSFARANISQMQRENAKQYKILRAFCLPQVQIFAAQNRVSSTLFGYSKVEII